MEQNRCISLLGSTGSIGRQSLDVIAACGMRVAALTANRDVEQMEKQCRRFQPERAVMMDPEAAASLRLRLADTPIRVAEGMEGLLEAASLEAADTVLTAVVGIVGLRPTLAAIRAGKRIALANKETLVCAGELVSDAAAWSGSQVVPVDSEHSAIFQCLQGCQDRGEVRRLILTASGGPFWGWKGEDLAGVTVEQALAHPNWNMGAKISVDSATMMNKGLEFIEAMRLYHMPPEKISIVIHRESIVHSLVEYCDHAVLAQLGVPDMRLPIQYALTWPGRVAAVAEPLDLLSCPPRTMWRSPVWPWPWRPPAPAAPPRRCSTGPTRRPWGSSWPDSSLFPALRSRWPTPWPRFPRCSLPPWGTFWTRIRRRGRPCGDTGPIRTE